MQTRLSSAYAALPEGQEAAAVLQRCVHCGFCTATCPTYQLLGDELDGPRGRIYLIKQVLEGQTPTRKTQQHLDRCLTCRACETTCPSGVAYGQLLDIGRTLVDAQVRRPWAERGQRLLLRKGLLSPLFALALRLGQWLRPVLPKALRAQVPVRRRAGAVPQRRHTRRVLLLAGCVQPSLAPGIQGATLRVLDACGISGIVAPEAGCCGAVPLHLGDGAAAQALMRANIDAWWPLVEEGAEALVMNASGCGVLVKDYGAQLRHDPRYAEKARRISALTCDLSELLPQISAALRAQRPQLVAQIAARAPALAWHAPCTLQHGQQLRGGVERYLTELGFSIEAPRSEAHLCCGSAGTYSLLQAALSQQLRTRKLGHLQALQPGVIVSANVGCIQHLQAGTQTPVQHWVEVLDQMLLTP